MKYSATAASLLILLGVMSSAQADERSAQVHVMETVEETCNIGLKFDIWDPNESGVADKYREVFSDMGVQGEINLLDSDYQNITGAVVCNAANGYKVSLRVGNGSFVNGSNNGASSVTYSVESDSSGFSSNMSNTFINITGPADPNGVYPVAESTSNEKETFRLKLKDYSFSGKEAGTYSEDFTFTISTI